MGTEKKVDENEQRFVAILEQLIAVIRKPLDEQIAALAARVETLETELAETDERLDKYEDHTRDLLDQAEKSLERRIGNCEDDVNDIRDDVAALERGAR
jgi:ABC-type transporter Mla subunit MlaD